MKEITKDEQKNTVKKIKKDYKLKNLSVDEKKEYFNQVYGLYGSEVYRKVTPKNIQKQDKKDLLRSGRFLDIYEKYGEAEYDKYINYMQSRDITNETNSKPKGMYNRFKNFLKRKIVSPILSVTMALPIGAVAISDMNKNDEFIEYNQNKERIDEYLDDIEEYAQSVKKMHLTDTEVLMKVTDDMWKSIDGYGDPENELRYYLGLNLAEDKIGVCRHMADDVARKLNAIDEDYNARLVTVYNEVNADAKNTNVYEFADITRNIVEDEEKTEESKDEQVSPTAEKVLKLFGNHAVVLVDAKETNATLVLDPTNPGIGVLKNGKIIMFNADSKNFTEKLTFFGNLLVGDPNFVGLSEQFASSFINTELSMEELEQKYGLEAQNKALESVREKEKTFKDKIVIQLDNGTTAIADLNKENQVIREDNREL